MSDYWGDEEQPVCPILERSMAEHMKNIGRPKIKFLRFALKRFALKCFTLKGKHRIGLTPLYWPQVRRRTGAMSREVFYGQSVHQSEGSQTAKGIRGRRMDGSFYFFLEPPKNI